MGFRGMKNAALRCMMRLFIENSILDIGSGEKIYKAGSDGLFCGVLPVFFCWSFLEKIQKRRTAFRDFFVVMRNDGIVRSQNPRSLVMLKQHVARATEIVFRFLDFCEAILFGIVERGQ
jgi:hypothetical protein